MGTSKDMDKLLAELGDAQACWMVRAGREAVPLGLFLDQSCVALGWGSLGDLSSVRDKAGMRARVELGSHGYGAQRAGQVAGMLLKLRQTIEVGDAVLTYDSHLRTYHVGIVRSGYAYVPDTEFGHQRAIEWASQVSRDGLSTVAQRGLGAQATLFQVREAAWREVLVAAERFTGSSNDTD